MYGELGYAAAYVHLFYMLSCVEWYVDIPLHTRQHVKQMNVRCRITKFTIYEDLNFKCDFNQDQLSSMMMIS
jgi:hypothetical protein